MGDAGEGLIDAESRIQERMDELERSRATRRGGLEVKNPAKQQAIESLQLARIELEHQLKATVHERRRAGIIQAIEEIDRRIAEVQAS